MIISISGFIGSGKDTAADYLVSRHGFKRQSWAGTLKDAVSSIFGWDRHMLEGKTPESRAWRELPDPWWTDRLGFEVSPRRVLQQWGTEVCRNGYHNQIWIASLENKLRRLDYDVVITDTRFPNEIEAVKRLGGVTVRITRDPEPSWVADYNKWGANQEFVAAWPDVHASEYSSIGLDYDWQITNNGSIQSLRGKLNDLVQHHLVAM